MVHRGYYGEFGGSFIPEVLFSSIEELADVFGQAREDPGFRAEYENILSTYSCRPTPLTFAENFKEVAGKSELWISRQVLREYAVVMTRTGIVEMAARFGLQCTIYMGMVDMARQRPNVFWMERLGAEVVPVRDGTRLLKDAINEALRDWITNMDTTHYVLGTACGPHPFPEMVAWFQSIIGREAREQIMKYEGRLPTRVYACVGGGSNALGIFNAFFNDPVALVGVEAGGQGLYTGKHAARLSSRDGAVGVAHGYKGCFLQDRDGQMKQTHSVAAGLDYVGVSPVLASLKCKGRVRFEAATDEEVLKAFSLVVRKEGLVPALESAHAFAQAFKELPDLCGHDIILINQSGRGDKDIFTIADAFGDPGWQAFIKERAAEYDA